MARELSAREALFCEYLKILHSPREAAARSGYPFPERSAVKLLKKAAIKRKISMEEKGRKEALDGLRRIAFGSVADAVWLCERGEGPSREERETRDLYLVSEIKFQKSGTVEMKFFDRIKALDMLRCDSAAASDKAEPFFKALGDAAKLTFETEEKDGI